jgi:hypothetical protein
VPVNWCLIERVGCHRFKASTGQLDPRFEGTLDEEIAIEGEPEPTSEIEMFMMKHQQDNDWLKNAFH